MLYMTGRMQVKEKNKQYHVLAVYDSVLNKLTFMSRQQITTAFYSKEEIKGIDWGVASFLPYGTDIGNLIINREFKKGYIVCNGEKDYIKYKEIFEVVRFSRILDIDTLRTGMSFLYKNLSVSVEKRDRKKCLYIRPSYYDKFKYNDMLWYAEQINELYTCCKRYNSNIIEWCIYTPVLKSINCDYLNDFALKHKKLMVNLYVHIQGAERLRVNYEGFGKVVPYSVTPTINILDFRGCKTIGILLSAINSVTTFSSLMFKPYSSILIQSKNDHELQAILSAIKSNAPTKVISYFECNSANIENSIKRQSASLSLMTNRQEYLFVINVLDSTSELWA